MRYGTITLISNLNFFLCCYQILIINVCYSFQVTNYLQEMAPDLCDRVELYSKRIPLFDEFNIEEEINNMLSKR